MRDIDRAQRLLGLFTSADCAEALAGDLIEERRSRGVFWFWRHVLGTVLAVSRSAVIDAPVRTLSLVAAGIHDGSRRYGPAEEKKCKKQ